MEVNYYIFGLYTRYPIVACAPPLGRVRRASKGILHTNIWLKLFKNNLNDRFGFINWSVLPHAWGISDQLTRIFVTDVTPTIYITLKLWSQEQLPKRAEVKTNT